MAYYEDYKKYKTKYLTLKGGQNGGVGVNGKFPITFDVLTHLMNKKKIEELDLSGCKFETYNDLKGVFIEFDNLKKIKLGVQEFFIKLDVLKNLTNKEKIEELDLSGCKFETFSDLQGVFIEFDNLKKITL